MSEISQLIGKDKYDQIKKLFEKITPSHEFEFMFYNYKNTIMSNEKFSTIMKYITLKSKGNIQVSDILDIVYREPKTDDTYRITVEGLENINKYMSMLHTKKNHVVFTVLKDMRLGGDKNISMMIKTKNAENVVDIDDLDIRCRLSTEKPLTDSDIKKIPGVTRENMYQVSYRLKNRSSYKVYSHSDGSFVQIDLTTTKNTKEINKIESTNPKYELEVECGASKPSDKLLDAVMNEIKILVKLLQQSNWIITKTISDKVLDTYAQVLSENRQNMTGLAGRNSYSLEIQHATENLPDAYAVTDKADGERNMLIIVDSHVYLINNTLVVRDTGIELSAKLDKYTGSILDGELIFLPRKNRHIFMVFDCLFNGQEDIRKNPKLMERLKVADQIIGDCFVLPSQSIHKFTDYNEKTSAFDLKSRLKFHEAQIIDYMGDLNKNILIDKSRVLIRRKYFIDAQGAKPWEIFAYSGLMYNKYTASKDVACPYLLDGLIYQPINQAYVTSKSSYLDYKWKPPTKNSIDFYVEFPKDKQGKVVPVYDNSIDEFVKNKPYKICHLHVGKRERDQELPTLFREPEQLYLAYMFLDDGEVRDVEGNIIMDKTVVEFYYNNDPAVSEHFRWIPLRTRYDKTDAVRLYKRKYGNYIDVADKVWSSIQIPVTMSDIEELAKGDQTYERKLASMRSNISHEMIKSSARDDAYYQMVSNLAKPMRQFHNWIKSIIIFTYCHPMYQNDLQMTVFDIGCGRGGDTLKFYHAKSSFYVGVDVDKEGLVNAVDGAISRYRQFKKNYPNFPDMSFIQADAGTILEYEEQNKVLGNMTPDNKKLFERFFPPNPADKVQFDRINCQFVMHYFLKDADTWNAYMKNVNNHLRPGGYMIVSFFDAERVNKLFADGSNTYTVHYTEKNGEKKVLFEIKKSYTDEAYKASKLGNAIELYAAWMFREGQYVTEYLVDHDFIVKTLAESCDLELVEHDFFENQYEIHRDYFKNYAVLDENLENRKFLMNVATFYEYNEMNGASFKYSRLQKYYVFRKKDSGSGVYKVAKQTIVGKVGKSGQSKSGQSKGQTGGNINELINQEATLIHDLDVASNETQTYIGSIHHILKTHKIIPKHVGLKEFAEDFDINLLDNTLDENSIKKIGTNLVITHTVNERTRPRSKPITKTVIKGLNTLILEQDCNGHWDLDDYTDKINPDARYIVLVKENEIYRPIYRSENNGISGLFSKSDDFIQQLIG